ncbi:MAG: hypothetical protein IJ250_07090 [Bacteroidales bacterium]|nr:hypothetical protein [Bacteroidales bacterium]MBQ7985380.1 hypothetical protein [Bacteroidales bacterium]
MKQIKSKTVNLTRSCEEVFYALSDFTHLGAMPNDKIKDFKCTYDTCSFSVNGMADVELVIKERKPFDYITIGSGKEIMGGFNFLVNLLFERTGQNTCNLTAEANIEGNTITLMMFKKQIVNGLDMLMDQIQKSVNSQTI